MVGYVVEKVVKNHVLKKYTLAREMAHLGR